MVMMLNSSEKQKIEREIFEREILTLKLTTFKQKTQFCIEYGDYIVKTAETATELAQIIKLRSHSFMADFTPDANLNHIDFDHYDLIADHVLVICKTTNELLGCYRIICSKFTNQCYSREQFNLGLFEHNTDIKIELGRACIHKDFRNGIILNLVWKGLAQYAMAVDARYMFGCASIKTTSRELAYSMYWHLYPAFFKGDYNVSVLPRFQFDKIGNKDQLLLWADVEKEIPTLLKSYLQAGAKICSEPALDTFFQCIDFLTVLDLQQIEAKYHRRYFSRGIG